MTHDPGIRIPDTPCGAATELVRTTEPACSINTRAVCSVGALTGERRQWPNDAELLISARCPRHGPDRCLQRAHERFEVDGANAARDFLKGYGIGEQTSSKCGFQSRDHHAGFPTQETGGGWSRRAWRWTCSAFAYDEFTDSSASSNRRASARGEFKEGSSMPSSRDDQKAGDDYGNVKADVLALRTHVQAPQFLQPDSGSSWNDSPADARIAATRRMIITKFRHVRTATPPLERPVYR